MARRQRPFALCQNFTVSTALADGDVAIPLIAPSEGAVIDRVLITQSVAGVGTATSPMLLQARGTTAASMMEAASLDLDAAAGTIQAVNGSGLAATAAGTVYDLNLVFTGVTTTAATLTFCVTWLP